MPEPTGPVVAGVEDAQDSEFLVRYAAGEAARNRRPLHLVHVTEAGDDTAAGRSRARAVTDPLLAAAQADSPDLEVRAEHLTGRPAAALVDRSAGASLLILGHRGGGGFPRLQLGSVSLQVATHAACPVTVLRPGRARTRAEDPVAVGVDDPESPSEAAQKALVFAARAADRRGAPLELVHAAPRPQLLQTGPAGPARASQGDLPFPEEQRLLEEQVARLREERPAREVTARVTEGHPAAVLAEASREAGLVVVGSHGRSGLQRLMLGSASAEVLHTASCPVAVVR